MAPKGAQVIQWFEELAPRRLAQPDDNIGLQIGTLNKPIHKVMVTLDVTEAVVDEAISQGIDLIIAHHAVIFRPIKHLQTDTPSGRIYEKCIKHDIAVYIAHTNLDVAEGGVNDLMADLLGLQDKQVLSTTYVEPYVKFVVFVPESHKQAVFEAITAAGAGSIGDYSHCTFQLDGTGTFLPTEGTNPFIGETGKIEHVQEVRLETIVSEGFVRKTVAAMKKAHPYEEPAYDLYPLKMEGKVYGLGRIGRLPEKMTLEAFTEQVKKAFDVPYARVVGDLTREVEKVAVLGGMGRSYMKDAIFKGADVYVTGDIDFHTAHDALAAGLSIIDPGHHTEKVMIKGVADWLRKKSAEHKQTVEVIESAVHTEPFRFV